MTLSKDHSNNHLHECDPYQQSRNSLTRKRGEQANNSTVTKPPSMIGGVGEGPTNKEHDGILWGNVNSLSRCG